MKNLIFLLLLICIVLCGCQAEVSQADWGSFSPQKTFSYDKAYYAEHEVVTVNDSRVIRVNIYNAEDTLVYSFQPARAADFWGVCWESDTYDIWIQSGDTGVHCYRYDNEKWTVDPSAVRPNYIVSKYD